MINECLLIGLHLFSAHSEGEWNEKNLGIYCSTENYTIGIYRNSINKQSFYITRDFEYKNFGVSAGVVTGYNYPIVPAIVPYYRQHLGDNFYLKMHTIPRIKNLTPFVLGFSIEKKF